MKRDAGSTTSFPVKCRYVSSGYFHDLMTGCEHVVPGDVCVGRGSHPQTAGLC